MNHTLSIYQLENEMQQLMKRELLTIREILYNIKCEQKVLLENNTTLLQTILKQREELLDVLHKLHSKTSTLNSKIMQIKNEKTCFSSEFECSIATLKEQITNVNNEIKNQTKQNNKLIENKITFTKDLIQQLHPSESPPTYSSKGTLQTQKKITTLTLINKEV
jgi:flagellar biosynthesis/type III secretory pathway chaperone